MQILNFLNQSWHIFKRNLILFTKDPNLDRDGREKFEGIEFEDIARKAVQCGFDRLDGSCSSLKYANLNKTFENLSYGTNLILLGIRLLKNFEKQR